MLRISGVSAGSVGEELGLNSGDEITAFNGAPARDILDYLYFDAASEFTMRVQGRDGETEFEIEKGEDETLGLEFGEDSLLQTKSCRNNCVFCFVAQLPKGLRDSLYVRDDDWRLSLICGNYVTLTNVSREEMQRIADMRMSPLYISVHSMAPETRIKLLRNPRGGDIAARLEFLQNAGIDMHCQLVLCPGYNTGEDLEYSLRKLSEFSRVRSCALVPVGLTGRRERLTPLKGLNREEAAECVRIAELANAKLPERRFFCADELYLLAGLPLPDCAYYGDFPQLENGVGLIAKFLAELKEAELPAGLTRRATLITGVSAAPFIRQAAEYVTSRVAGLELEVRAIVNRFFGESVTVAGLVTGGDILEQLAGVPLGDFAVLPRVMLREFETVFLDDMSVKELEAGLGVPVRVAEADGEGFVSAIVGE